MPVAGASEGGLVSLGSPSDDIPLSAREVALADARRGKRVRSGDADGSARKRANLGAPPLAPVVGSSALAVEGDGREKQLETDPSEFDFDFSFRGEGKQLTKFPRKCAELMSKLDGGEKFEVDYAEDCFAEKPYRSFSRKAVEMVAGVNQMTEHFDRSLKKARSRMEKSEKILANTRKTLKSTQESYEAEQSLSESLKAKLAKEKAVVEELKTKLKDEKRRLRESRAAEVARERKLADTKLGKLQRYIEGMEVVYEKRALLGQANCLKQLYGGLQEKGMVVEPEKIELIENDLKTLPGELQKMEVAAGEIGPADFLMVPDAETFVEQWTPSSPVSEGSPSPIRVVDEVDPRTGEFLSPLFSPGAAS